MRTFILSAAVLMSLVLSSTANAGFAYHLEAADASNVSGTLGNGAFDFSSSPGGTVNLYLVQRSGPLGVAGSQAINFRLSNTSTIATQTAGPGTAAFSTNNNSNSLPPTIHQFNNFNLVGMTPSTLIGTTGLQGWQVGSMTFGGLTGQTGTFTFTSLGGNNINVEGTNITSSVAASTFTVAVPEPSSLALIGIGGALAFFRRRRA